MVPATLSNIAKIARDARETVATHLSDGLSRQRFWTRFFQKALRADSAEKITQDDLSHELRSFVPQGSSATVPSGQSLRLDVDANNAYDIPHGIARHVETADIIFHNDDIAPDILALARRDATLVDLTAATFDSEETLGKQIQFFTQQGMNVLQLCRT